MGLLIKKNETHENSSPFSEKQLNLTRPISSGHTGEKEQKSTLESKLQRAYMTHLGYVYIIQNSKRKTCLMMFCMKAFHKFKLENKRYNVLDGLL